MRLRLIIILAGYRFLCWDFSSAFLALTVELTDKHCIELTKVQKGQDERTDVHESLCKASHITEPVQHAVDLSVDDGQIQVSFIGYLYVHVVVEFVGSRPSLHNLENVAHLLLRVGAPLPDRVLELKLIDAELEHDLLSHLRADWDPSRARLFDYL